MACGILVAAAAAPGSSLRAGESASPALQFSGNLRLRQETLHGQYRPGFDAHDDMLAVRGSLLAEWTSGDWKVAAELSDSRAYDTDAGSVLSANEVNALEPVQAYVSRSFRDAVGPGTSVTVQAGRFLMNLGSRRLVASDEFRNTPQGSTGLRVDLRGADQSQATFFYIYPQQRRPDDRSALRDNRVALDHEGHDQRLWGVVVASPGLMPGGVLGEFTYIRFREQDTADRPTRNRDLHNIGLRAIREPAAGRADFEFEVIYQTGHLRSGLAAAASRLDVGAGFVHADAGYTFATAGKPRLSLEYDRAGGDGPGAKFGRFDTLFGMRRADLAPSGIYGLLGRTNLESIGARLEITPSARLDAMATYRLTWAADRHDAFSTSGIRDATGASGRFAGGQLDGRVRYWLLPKRLRGELNAVWFDRGRLMRTAPNASAHGDPVYVAVSATLSF